METSATSETAEPVLSPPRNGIDDQVTKFFCTFRRCEISKSIFPRRIPIASLIYLAIGNRF